MPASSHHGVKKFLNSLLVLNQWIFTKININNGKSCQILLIYQVLDAMALKDFLKLSSDICYTT